MAKTKLKKPIEVEVLPPLSETRNGELMKSESKISGKIKLTETEIEISVDIWLGRKSQKKN